MKKVIQYGWLSLIFLDYLFALFRCPLTPSAELLKNNDFLIAAFTVSFNT
jgi:hypothetical protein